MIRSGQIALLSFPQTDQAVGRLRPTLVLRRLPGPSAEIRMASYAGRKPQIRILCGSI